MSKIDDPDAFNFASPQFYLMEMQKSAAYFQSGNYSSIGLCVLAIFSGEAVNDERQKKVNTRHIEFYLHYKGQVCSPGHFIEWLKILYYYFNTMSAMPELAEEIWDYCWKYLDAFDGNDAGVFQTRLMLAQWAFNYNPDKHKKAIEVIESSETESKLDELCKSQFLSSGAGLSDERINDKRNYAKFVYENRNFIDPPNRILAVTDYLGLIERNETALGDWYEALEDYSAYAKNLNPDYRLIDPMIFQCFFHEDYSYLLKIIRLINGSLDNTKIDNHAFVSPVIEHSRFIMTESKSFDSDSDLIVESYKNLTKKLNAIGRYATSLRGDFEVDFNYDDPNRFGTINQDAPCHQLREATESLYNLHEPGLWCVNTATIVPFHNHPIQSSLCHIGIEPPLLLVSMNSPMPQALCPGYVFFLSTDTVTYEIEKKFILRVFGSDALIFTNPDLATVKKYFEKPETTHLYISAHGIYQHWKPGEASIHFNKGQSISERDLDMINNASQHEKVVILNVCDGGRAEISYNPTKSGLATTLVRKQMVVFSHHWPVTSLYAGVLGCLLMFYIKLYPIKKCMLLAYETLNKPNEEIASSLRELDDSFLELSERVLNSGLQISEFKNLVSFCAMR